MEKKRVLGMIFFVEKQHSFDNKFSENRMARQADKETRIKSTGSIVNRHSF